MANYTKLVKSLLKDGEVLDETTNNKLVEENGTIVELHYCTKCKSWKPVSEFYKFNGIPLTQCIQCKRNYNKQRGATINALEKKIQSLQQEKTQAERGLETERKSQDDIAKAMSVILKAITLAQAKYIE